MASDPRRFDQIEKVVRDVRRAGEDSTATVLARLAAHTHAAASHTHTESDVTSLVTDLSGKVPLSTATTKGDLLVATASGTIVRHGVGSNNQCLVADSAQADGMKWDYQSLAVVSSTATITSPYTGQVIFNTTDNMLYRYTGSAWVAFAATGTTSHEARYQQTSGQSITNATDTKVQFPTAITTSSDVTASGTGNTDFSLSRLGLWLVTASVRYFAASAGERNLSLLTGTNVGTLSARFAIQSTFPGSAAGPVGLASVIRISSTTSVCVGTWQNNGSAVALETAWGATNHISLTWLRP